MRERERENNCGDHIFYLWVLLLPLRLILSLRKLWGFLLYGFPKENFVCLLSLVIIVVYVILSIKILRSYCLNDKNLTWMTHIINLLPLFLRRVHIFNMFHLFEEGPYLHCSSLQGNSVSSSSMFLLARMDLYHYCSSLQGKSFHYTPSLS